MQKDGRATTDEEARIQELEKENARLSEELRAARRDLVSERNQAAEALRENEDRLGRAVSDERSARLDAETARAQSEHANRTKDEFLSTVSHELRTPLNAILGWAAMLHSGKLDATATTKAIETIERNARVQARLIEDLLDLGRAVQGQFKLAVAPVEVVRVVEGALESVRPAADAKGVRLHPILDDDATLLGDPIRLQQITWNLLSNAVKFTPRGGRVQVTVRRVPSHVELVVGDTGVGISQDFLPHVFEAFRQEDGSVSRRSGGLGLGLSIVRSLVELHGGTVSAKSDGVGFGATFTVRLPVAPVQTETAKTLPQATSKSSGTITKEARAVLSGLRVLLVDDEQDSRELVAFVLEQRDAVVTAAASSAEGFAHLQRSPFDVLVSDVGMPEEDGHMFLKRVRMLPVDKGGRIPALALTAYARVEDRAQALGAGFTMHLAKPIDPTELVLVLAALASGQR